MRKQGVDAGLGLGRIEDELRFTVLLQNGIVMVHGYRTVGGSAGAGAKAEDGVVQAVSERGRRNCDEDGANEYPPQPHFQA